MVVIDELRKHPSKVALADRYAVLKVGRVVETGRTADAGAREKIERHLVL